MRQHFYFAIIGNFYQSSNLRKSKQEGHFVENVSSTAAFFWFEIHLKENIFSRDLSTKIQHNPFYSVWNPQQ